MNLRTIRTFGILMAGTLMVVLGIGRAIGQGINSDRDRFGNSVTGGIGSNPYSASDEQLAEQGATNKADTTKRKPKKPLESYFFDDSLRVQPSWAWNVDLTQNKIKMAAIDTLLDGHNVDYEFLRKGVGSAYIGQLGGAAVPLNYFDRTKNRDFSFINSYDNYLFNPENVRHFNTKHAFTQFNYGWAGQVNSQEENFGITHAQNASPSTGFNLDYKSRGTKGVYTWQGTRDKSLSMAIEHTGKKYTAHAGYIYNSVNLKENGGLIRDTDITDTIVELPLNIEVRLKDARNIFKNNTLYLVQSYGVPLSRLSEDDFSIADKSSIFVGHSIEYSQFSRTYTDSKPTEKEFQYYSDWLVNPLVSADSIAETRLSNRVFVQIQPWDRDGVIGVINAGAGHDMHSYYNFRPDQYLTGIDKGVSKNSSYLYGSVDGKIKKYFDWSADARIVPVGYRSGDLSVGGKASLTAYIQGKPVSLSGSLRNELHSASYWDENYSSNHYQWLNSFEKENETRIELTLEAPAYGLELQAFQSVVVNKIYYGADCRPAQSGASVSISGMYARKDFALGVVHLNNRVLLQWSSAQEIVPVALASAYFNYFLRLTVVKSVLNVDLGVDGRYNTLYYAPGYNPATAQFYNQREKKLGNYINMDAYAAAKWKRMRILLKMEHANQNMFGKRNYFTVLHYPQNPRVLKLGISWGFYD